VTSDYPKGSAGDVQAYGVYSKAIDEPTEDQRMDAATPGYWYKEKWGRYKEASWFVEFYRLLATATPNEDYAINKDGNNLFALAIHDQSAAGDHYSTGAIRLRFGKLKGL
jgi:hypothetical protein